MNVKFKTRYEKYGILESAILIDNIEFYDKFKNTELDVDIHSLIYGENLELKECLIITNKEI